MNEVTKKWSIRIIMWSLIVASVPVFSKLSTASRIVMALSMFFGVLYAVYILFEIEVWKGKNKEKKEK